MSSTGLTRFQTVEELIELEYIVTDSRLLCLMYCFNGVVSCAFPRAFWARRTSNGGKGACRLQRTCGCLMLLRPVCDCVPVVVVTWPRIRISTGLKLPAGLSAPLALSSVHARKVPAMSTTTDVSILVVPGQWSDFFKAFEEDELCQDQHNDFHQTGRLSDEDADVAASLAGL